MFSSTVISKVHKVKDPFCTVCETFLSGNGSIIYPWRCDCGEYKFDYEENQYVITPIKDGDNP